MTQTTTMSTVNARVEKRGATRARLLRPHINARLAQSTAVATSTRVIETHDHLAGRILQHDANASSLKGSHRGISGDLVRSASSCAVRAARRRHS